MKLIKILKFLFVILIVIQSEYLFAQQDCSQGSTAPPIFLETFGAGSNPGSQLPANRTDYWYTAGWPTDGAYAIWNRSNPNNGGKPFWYDTLDHTGDKNGYMMVVNAATAPGEFYRQRVTGLCPKTTFICSVWAANVNTPNISDLCGGCDKPNILIKIENITGTVLSSSATGDIPFTVGGMVWKKYSLVFSPQAGETDIDFVLVNNTPGGNGNDLVLDDISFRICLPNVTLSTAAHTCVGQDVTIKGKLDLGFVDPQMQWQADSGSGVWKDLPKDTTIDLLVKNVKLPPPVIKYRLIVSERGNIKAPHCRVISDPIFINIVPNPTVTISVIKPATCGSNSGSANTKCIGGLPSYKYLWLPGGATSQDTTGLKPGTYTVIATDQNGCKSTATADIKMEDSPTLDVSTNSDVSCFKGNDGSATAKVTGGTGTLTYLWIPSGQTTATATGLSSQTYTIVVTDANHCTDLKTVTITQPSASVSVNTFISGFSCAGSSPDATINATAVGGTPPYSFLWIPGNSTTPSISHLSSGTYSVTITDSKGCKFTKSTEVPTSTKPTARFKSEPIISCEGVTVKFTDESTPTPNSWLWNFGDGQKSQDQNPKHYYQYNAGVFKVTLITAIPPCYDTITSNITINDLFKYLDFKRANIFTPNGDGINDCFVPALVGDGAKSLEPCVSLIILDRWGVKVFESKDKHCWDGKINGQPAVDGIYYYVATLKNSTIKGSVTLVRNSR